MYVGFGVGGKGLGSGVWGFICTRVWFWGLGAGDCFVRFGFGVWGPGFTFMANSKRIHVSGFRVEVRVLRVKTVGLIM